MNKIIKKNITRIRRKKSVRKSITGTAARPRVSVFRSNRYIYAQAIDDVAKITLAGISETNLKNDKVKASGKMDMAMRVGEELGKLLIDKKVAAAVFDRSGFKYHGRVKAVAEGLRKTGLKL
jgi:large subunit ribosomal protein L18